MDNPMTEKDILSSTLPTSPLSSYPGSPFSSASITSTPGTPQFSGEISKPIILRPWQIEWSERISDILVSRHGYIDTSRLGAGKTFVTLYIAQKFNLRPLVICPVTVKDVWMKVIEEYKIPYINIISYRSLASVWSKQPKHGFLRRHDYIKTTKKRGTRKVDFYPTEKYLDLLLQKNVLIVLDEVQSVKNDNAQNKSCRTLIGSMYDLPTQSRFALLSGTPFDKPIHAENLFRVMGFLRGRTLKSGKDLSGINEVIEKCSAIDPVTTAQVLMGKLSIKTRIDTARNLLYELWLEVIKPAMSGAMPTPTNISAEFEPRNTFYKLHLDRLLEMSEAIEKLKNIVQYDAENDTIALTGDFGGYIFSVLVSVENAKIEIFIHQALRYLQENNNNKVIVALNYYSTIEPVAEALAYYDPLILTGSVPPRDRKDVIQAFNENPSYRLLIMNTLVGGMGISLHDTSGDYPRVMLISPSFRLIEMAQAAGRIYRDNTRSIAKVRVVYVKEFPEEFLIYKKLSEKSGVVHSLLEDDLSQDVIFPGEYPAEMEV